MAQHVADEHARLRFRERQYAKEIATDLLCRLIPMAETQPTFLRRQIRRKARIRLCEKYLLNVARHLKIGFELRILEAQLLCVARKVFFGFLPLFFSAFTTRDVLHHALVVEQLAGNLVVYGTGIFRDPNDAPVAAINLRFELQDSLVLLHCQSEFSATTGLDVKLPADVGQRREQLIG